MNKRAETFFSAEELERISRAVEAAEAVTSGEIALMIVNESDQYREAALSGAMFTSALIAIVVSVAFHHVTVWSFLPLLLLFFLPAHLIFKRFPQVKLSFTSKIRISEAVRQRALRAFYEKGLYRTKHETGILIFMSLVERKVWILGDKGINEKIEPGAWQGYAAELATGIAEGRGCDSLCSVIGKCGVVLADNFPHMADDINELPDQLITEK